MEVAIWAQAILMLVLAVDWLVEAFDAWAF
jgi:hypothetical protein